ncbi:hypothetical protein B0T09DRAFT_379957 [Sordaria sp. MPI-SDFR-AT-0083]|nr:hypothetical protein B0T09DRAFT_379957 [Sordaria sp. MPI-SDFR-AT-0083]
MEVYFGRIQQTMDLPDLPSRLRFMLMDIVDLRKARWVSKEIAEPWFKQWQPPQERQTPTSTSYQGGPA